MVTDREQKGLQIAALRKIKKIVWGGWFLLRLAMGIPTRLIWRARNALAQIAGFEARSANTSLRLNTPFSERLSLTVKPLSPRPPRQSKLLKSPTVRIGQPTMQPRLRKRVGLWNCWQTYALTSLSLSKSERGGPGFPCQIWYLLPPTRSICAFHLDGSPVI